MIVTHASIKESVARAFASSKDVASFCVQNFGQPALVIVD